MKHSSSTGRKRRFRIRQLEERIAPTSCPGGPPIANPAALEGRLADHPVHGVNPGGQVAVQHMPMHAILNWHGRATCTGGEV